MAALRVPGDDRVSGPDIPAPIVVPHLECRKYREVAERTIKRQRIIDYIAQKEKIQATQEEVDAEIKKLALQYNQPFETLKQTLRQNGTTLRIREELREQKTLDFLIDELPVAAEK